MIVVIPSARHVHLEYLQPLIDSGARFIVVDDSPGRITVDHPQFALYSWTDQRRILGDLTIAIPRGTGACRDFGFLVAWMQSEPDEVIVALDDDCLVEDGDFAQLTERCLTQRDRFRVCVSSRHWNVLDLYREVPENLFPRGFPYSARVGYEHCSYDGLVSGAPMFHLGLWRGVFDINAIDKLDGPGYVHDDAELEHDAVVVPPGVLVSACSMNMVFRRDVIPAVYQLPMCVEVMPGWVVDRYGDIWGGFVLKTLMDRRGDVMSVGGPMIRHVKRGDIQRNIWQEHVAHLVNDEFIQIIEGIGAGDGPYLDMMEHTAAHLSAARTACSPILHGYLDHLVPAMEAWVTALRRFG